MVRGLLAPPSLVAHGRPGLARRRGRGPLTQCLPQGSPPRWRPAGAGWLPWPCSKAGVPPCARGLWPPRGPCVGHPGGRTPR
eukprot:11578688-Alexandrium_andersonii.AAC.1